MADGNQDEKSDYVFLRPNRRKNLRNPLLVLKVKVESESKSFFGYAKVISSGGMFIASINPKQVGEDFIIEFTLPDKTHIRCKCRVAWRREFIPKSPHEPGMGIKFLDLPDDTRDKIDEWVKKE